MNDVLDFVSVRLDDENDELIILDQSKLPNDLIYHHYKTKEEIFKAITGLEVRGAPAIGIAAAYGIYLSIKHLNQKSHKEFFDVFEQNKDFLASSRPTAVNLFWALNRMEQCLMNNKEKSISEIIGLLKIEAENIRQEDEAVCHAIGVNALTLLTPNMGLLTHCNAGTLATAKYGTALAPMYLGHQQGYDFRVFADETRPLLQGARLTAWELHEAGIDVTLICDNMASIVMKKGLIDAVLVGCDRVAANGDTANKIGTSGVAILAKNYNIPFYVCAPCSTIDIQTGCGDDIEIELRKGEEITSTWYQKPRAPLNVKTFNPAFDVTDANLITAIITEKGILYPPYSESIKKLFEGESK
jgi:methylthioribose-1-phosphate isomerase